jgi:hypothetical protein
MEVRGFRFQTDPNRNQVKPEIFLNEGLILAQDERWRRALRMQVERSFGIVADG